jgi:16S rRNA (cytosine967-C5)-methyltransferase
LEAIIKPFQLAIAAQLIDNYKGDMPFATYFTAQCKLHPNWGSRDRKIYRQACYAFFRLGFAAKQGTTQNNILLALQGAEEIIGQIDTRSVFPDNKLVSPMIVFEDWVKGLMTQKPVYLSLVKGKEDKVKSMLEERGIPYDTLNENCLRIGPNANCNDITDMGLAWIMDISSQEAAGKVRINAGDEVWDCCSGAGGKALFLTNKYGNDIKLTCSDSRFTILNNLKERFYKCGLAMPHTELCDLTSPFQLSKKFDHVIADVPCSGSGTWGRTPENITRTDHAKVLFYSKLQRAIIENAGKNLARGGRLHYITCSVFSEENELNTSYFVNKAGMKPIRMEYINICGKESDWLFYSELEKL